MEDENSIGRKFYYFYNKWWVRTIVILTMTSTWFILLQFFGKQWLFIDNEGVLNLKGIVITLIMILLNIAFSIFKSVLDKEYKIFINKKQKEIENEKQEAINGQVILNDLLEELNLASQKKLAYYAKGVLARDSNNFNIEQACVDREHITQILYHIQSVVSSLSDVEKSNIGLSIIYQNGKEWTWLEQINVDHDLTIEEILNNPNTAARQIIDKKKHVVFFPDKNVGEKAHEFVSGDLDKQNKNLGSIYCKDISIKKDKKGKEDKIGAILTITTYGGVICAQTDNVKQRIFSSVIMPKLETQLMNEICLLYMTKKIEFF